MGNAMRKTIPMKYSKKFTPVVCLYGSRFAALVHDPVQHPRYVFAFQALADVDCKALT